MFANEQVSMNHQFKVNVSPSPLDERDWIAETIYKSQSVQPTYTCVPDLQPIRDQGSQGTCAAQVAACMKEWQEKHDVTFDSHMSPQFIYNNRINQEGEGMYGRDVMNILYRTGVCPEADYKYGLVQQPDEIDSLIYETAQNYTIVNYAKVNTIDGLKSALVKNGPCFIALPVYNYSPTMWKPEIVGTEQIGGHGMTVVGYDSVGFTIRNSWGTGWGDKGYCVFPYTDWGCQWEVWTTVDGKSIYNEADDDSKNKKCCLCM
jgi:C1A family cysteine protease